MLVDEFVVQTRSEQNGLLSFATLEDALKMASADETIWKVSFSLPTGERCRLVRYYIPEMSTALWKYEKVI